MRDREERSNCAGEVDAALDWPHAVHDAHEPHGLARRSEPILDSGHIGTQYMLGAHLRLGVNRYRSIPLVGFLFTTLPPRTISSSPRWAILTARLRTTARIARHVGPPTMRATSLGQIERPLRLQSNARTAASMRRFVPTAFGGRHQP